MGKAERTDPSLLHEDQELFRSGETSADRSACRNPFRDRIVPFESSPSVPSIGQDAFLPRDAGPSGNPEPVHIERTAIPVIPACCPWKRKGADLP